MSKREPGELEDVVGRTLTALAAAGAEAALIGGIAVGIRTRPRTTKDVDLQVVVDEQGRARLDDAMAAEGLPLVITHADGSIRRYRDAVSGAAVDILIAEVPLEEAAVRNATELPFGALRIRVARAEELLALKVLASRPDSDDLRDARALVVASGGDLDLDQVRAYLAVFGIEYLQRLERLVAGVVAS